MSRVVPDPGLTLSETLNAMGVIHTRLQVTSDAVLESVWDKLRRSANHVYEHHPEEFEAVVNEIQMQKRFGVGR